MYCPEHLVLEKGPLMVWMYWRDVPREKIPLRIWLNPLRYQITWRSPYICINREGMWAGRLYAAVYGPRLVKNDRA